MTRWSAHIRKKAIEALEAGFTSDQVSEDLGS